MNRPNHSGHQPPKAFRYELEDGWVVLAGKTDADNEALSLKTANPEDWWFHVRGMPGSHVILRQPQGKNPDKRILKQAASIAAYYPPSAQSAQLEIWDRTPRSPHHRSSPPPTQHAHPHP